MCCSPGSWRRRPSCSTPSARRCSSTTRRPTNCGRRSPRVPARQEIRIPAQAGIAGAAFSGGEVLVVPDAYADPRFNRAVDRASGYRTRNILAVPIIDKTGERLGVVQVLNKRGGAFTPIDIRRAQGVLRPDRHRDPKRAAVLRRPRAEELQREHPEVAVERRHHARSEPQHRQDQRGGRAHPWHRRRTRCSTGRPTQVFGNRNAWVTRSLDYVASMGASDYHADTDFALPDGSVAAINLTAAPLFESRGQADRLHAGARRHHPRKTGAQHDGALCRQGGCRQAACQRPGFSRRKFPRRHRAVLRHPALHDAGRGDEPAGNGDDAQRLFHQHGRGRVPPTAACSTNISATRSWRCSARRSASLRCR